MRVLALVVTLLAAAAGCSFGEDDFEPRSFDATAWRTTESERGAMVDDLLDRHLRLGMSRSAVLRRLGPPDISGTRAAESGVLGTYDVYEVGRYKRQAEDYLTLFFVHSRLREIDRPIGVPLSDLAE